MGRATAQWFDLLQRYQLGTMDHEARREDRKRLHDFTGTVTSLSWSLPRRLRLVKIYPRRFLTDIDRSYSFQSLEIDYFDSSRL